VSAQPKQNNSRLLFQTRPYLSGKSRAIAPSSCRIEIILKGDFLEQQDTLNVKGLTIAVAVSKCCHCGFKSVAYVQFYNNACDKVPEKFLTSPLVKLEIVATSLQDNQV
jgi:hypothetical protein